MYAAQPIRTFDFFWPVTSEGSTTDCHQLQPGFYLSLCQEIDCLQEQTGCCRRLILDSIVSQVRLPVRVILHKLSRSGFAIDKPAQNLIKRTWSQQINTLHLFKSSQVQQISSAFKVTSVPGRRYFHIFHGSNSRSSSSYTGSCFS